MSWFDILVIIVAVYSFFKGYTSGLVKQLASLAGMVACVLLSGKISSIILPYLQNLNKIPEYLVEPAAYITAFILILAAFMLIGHMLQNILTTVKLGMLNKLAGSALCLVKWMLIISLVLNLLIKMDQNHYLIPADLETHSKTYPIVRPIAPAIAPYLDFDFSKDKSDISE